MIDYRRDDMAFDRKQIQLKAAELAARGVFIGTSSWKYAGWLGQLYTPVRYQKAKVASDTHSETLLFPELDGESASNQPTKFDDKRFEQECLSEYAEVFKTVSVDATYYDFPRREYLQVLADQVPDDFRFGFKITDAVTIKRFPPVAKSGAKAGQQNPNFLNADLFAKAFLKPCEAIRQKVGVLMFEFSRFWPSDYRHSRDFIGDLDNFLGNLPAEWPYAIELRNKDFLVPEYFECLARHQVTHLFNSWEAMLPVSEQMALPGSTTNPELTVARFLLKPGRKYKDAVKTFQPYDRTHEVNEEARKAGATLIGQGPAAEKKGKTFIFVNNRLEGNALETINSMIEATV
jgi:uncharacterized protein YecE (DUF72 family)